MMNRAALALISIAACASTPSLSPDQQAYYHAIRTANLASTDEYALRIAHDSLPLSQADRDAVLAAEAAVAAIAPDPIAPDAIQLEVAFDGTWDNRDTMAFETNPALLDTLFDGAKHYEKGVGTSTITKLLGGVAGYGIKSRIDHAYDWVVDQVHQIERATPNAEIALVVTGFSRGSTTARAFVNVLNKRGFARAKIAAMILFDTVGSVGLPGTNLNPGLDLSIPANAANVLHVIARDEKRKMFPLSSAVDPSQPHDPRIIEIGLPGVHSDIGGSYPNGYSKIPLYIAYDYLRRAGVHLKPIGDIPDIHDPSLRVHRSGGTSVRTIFPSSNPR